MTNFKRISKNYFTFLENFQRVLGGRGGKARMKNTFDQLT